MLYQLSEITEDVRLCMDENTGSVSLFADGDTDTLMLRSLIRKKIIEAVERVHRTAPYHKIDTGHNIEDSDDAGIHWDTGDSCGWIVLPRDFMRLVVFEMSDWERPVYELLSVGDVRYSRQRSRRKGIRGTVQRPVCVLGVRPEGRVLEFYSCNSAEATVSRGIYLPCPRIETDIVTESEAIDVSRQCYDAVVYIAAGQVLITQGDTERGQLLVTTGENNLQI